MLNKIKKNLVCFDTHKKVYYTFINNQFMQIDLPKKSDFLVSYIQYKDLIIGQIEIDTQNDDLPNQISIKTYEEFALDTKISYKIVYKELFLGSENRIFNIFVIKSEKIEQIFKKVATNSFYIDNVIAAPLLFEALYNKNIINKNQTNAFITLQDNDAFIAFYKDGEYAYSRPLQYSIKNIYDKFILISQTNINDNDFKELLKLQNRHQDVFLQIFNDLVYFLNDVTNSFCRICKTDIKNIFIISDFYIQNLAEILQSNLNIKTAFFELNGKDYTFKKILNITAENCIEDKNFGLNLTPFPRPENIFKRQSGKLILSAIIAMIVMLIFPIFSVTKAIFLQNQNDILDMQIEKLTNKLNSKISKIKVLNEQQDRLKKELESEENLTITKRDLLFNLDEKKTNYISKAATLTEISNFLKIKNIKLLGIQSIDNNLTLQLQGKNDSDITQFIQNVGYDENFLVYTKEILRNSNGDFESNITVLKR